MGTHQQTFLLAADKFYEITVLAMEVEVVKIETKHLCSFGRYLYVVRIRQRKCLHMDYYVEKVHDFGAYPTSDMADAVADAIKSGEIKIDMDLI